MAAPWYGYWLGHPFRTLGWAARAVAAVHVFMEYCYDTPYAWGPSMLPTLEADNTWLLQSRWHSRGRGVEVGDLVSYKIPIFENHFAIKRVLGMPGDYVLTGMPGDEHQEMIQVPKGHCWLVGDNLPASRDSRQYGPVPLALVRGKVLASLWPLWTPHWIENPLKRPQSGDSSA